MSEADAAARRESESTSRIAEVLDRRAARAPAGMRDRGAGDPADDAVAAELAPLAGAGWLVLHDRVSPSGENISHIVVGPGAVIVLTAKAWNGTIEIRNGTLYNSGWSQARVLNHLLAQAETVRAVLGLDELVDHALVITTQPDLPPGRVGDAAVLGLASLRSAIVETRDVYSPAQVEHMRTVLAEAFPSVGSTRRGPQPSVAGLHSIDGIEVGELFARANRFFYLDQRRRAGRRRIHLTADDGRPLGHKDVATGEVHLSHRDDVMAGVVLAAAATDGVHLRARDLPELPIDVRGGRPRGVLGRLHTTAIIGNLWHGKGRRLLYATLANPTDGVFHLGYVDVDTGWITPAIDGPIAPDRGPATRYLALLRDRFPSIPPDQ